MQRECLNLPFDLEDKTLFGIINKVSEQQVIDDPKALVPLIQNLNEDTRAIILSPFSIISTNDKKKKVRIDRIEWNTLGFKPKLHPLIFHLAELPIEKVPENIQASALCVGSITLELFLNESGCAHATDNALEYLWPHFLRFEQRIYSEAKDGKPHNFMGSDTRCAWMTQAEFNDVNNLKCDSPADKHPQELIFERSSEITLEKAIKNCFRYGADKNDAIYEIVYGEPNRKQVKEAIALAGSGCEKQFIDHIFYTTKSLQGFSINHSMKQLMEMFDVAETTLRTFIKSEKNKQDRYIIQVKRGKFIYRTTQKERIRSFFH